VTLAARVKEEASAAIERDAVRIVSLLPLHGGRAEI